MKYNPAASRPAPRSCRRGIRCRVSGFDPKTRVCNNCGLQVTHEKKKSEETAVDETSS